jgi:lipopolysaccharide export system protein LptC
MTIRTYNLFPLAVLLLLAALTFWLERATRLEQTYKDVKLRHDPDFIAERFTVRQLDANGKVKYSLAAEKMLHYADDESTDVTEPRLTYFENPPPLHLQARRANISKDAKIVFLKDDVFGRREPDAADPEMTFKSSELTVYPDDEIARTPAPVTLTQGRTVAHGLGMDADNLNRIFTLHERVKATIYQRKQQR